MKRTVVLMASPRLQSNTDILANKIIDGLKSVSSPGDVCDKIDLVELQDYVCCACGHCRGAGECLQFPEVNKILEKIKEADGLVIATPTWWMGPSSYLKIFIDHWGAFLRPDYSSRVAGKRAVIAACCGNARENVSEKVCADLTQILSFIGIKVVGRLAIKGVAELGAVSHKEEALQDAFHLGTKLYKEQS